MLRMQWVLSPLRSLVLEERRGRTDGVQLEPARAGWGDCLFLLVECSASEKKPSPSRQIDVRVACMHVISSRWRVGVCHCLSE